MKIQSRKDAKHTDTCFTHTGKIYNFVNIKINGIFQTPLPVLTVRVDAVQYRQAKNETVNSSTGQGDHSNLSENPFVSDASSWLPRDSTIWANEQCCERLSSRQATLREA